MWAYGMRGDSAGDWGRSLEYELGANVPATRRACMLAISSSENPASRRDVIQDGGSPVYLFRTSWRHSEDCEGKVRRTYPSSTCMLCWRRRWQKRVKLWRTAAMGGYNSPGSSMAWKCPHLVAAAAMAAADHRQKMWVSCWLETLGCVCRT